MAFSFIKRDIKSSPGRKRNDHTEGGARRIQKIGQRFQGDLLRSQIVPHAQSHREHVEIIIDKNDGSQHKCTQKGAALRPAEFFPDAGKASGSPGLPQHCDQTAEQTADQDNPLIIRTRQRGQERFHPGKKKPVPCIMIQARTDPARRDSKDFRVRTAITMIKMMGQG